MARELKQLGKEFKQAAQSLSGGAGTVALTSGASVQALGASAANGTAGSTDIAAAATVSDGVPAHGLVPADGAGEPVKTAARSQPDATPASAEVAGEERELSGQPSPQQSLSGTDAATLGGSPTAPSEFKAVSEAYSNPPGSSQSQAAEHNSATAKKAHAEQLRKIQQDLKAIAARIKALARRDDKEAKQELGKAEDELREGGQALDQHRSQQVAAAETGSSGVDNGPGPVTQSVAGTPVSILAVAIPASIPTNVVV